MLEDWTTTGPNEWPAITSLSATAADVVVLLARSEVADLDAAVRPLLADAAAELAARAGIAWSPSESDAPVALVRLIAAVAIRRPLAGGPCTERLHDALQPGHR